MPQAANIVINDGKATPVAHTFVPSKVSDLVVTYNGPGSTLATREQIVVTRREATAAVAGKVQIKLVQPIEQTVDGQVVLNYQDMCSLEFVVAPKSTNAIRKDLRTLAANLLQNAQIAAMIDDGDGVY